MNLEEAIELCKELKCHAYVDVQINEKGEVKVTSVNIWGAKRKDILEFRKAAGITMKKRFSEMFGDIDWLFDNVTFNKVEQCKIVGYKEEVVPEHTKKVPIWDCPKGTRR